MEKDEQKAVVRGGGESGDENYQNGSREEIGSMSRKKTG